ncbi:MAG: hypothetical protein ACRDQD_02340 [Nocardioidaceae bacterium]
MRSHELERASLALQSVRTALLRRASADADRIAEAARRDADSHAATARAQVDAVLHRVATDTEAQALEEVVVARTDSRREARVAELAAQRDAYDEFHRRVLSSVVALRHDPAYPEVQDRLTAQAQRALGPDAAITEAPEGGVIGEAPGRRLDLSLSSIAERAVAAAGVRVAKLWSR